VHLIVTQKVQNSKQPIAPVNTQPNPFCNGHFPVDHWNTKSHISMMYNIIPFEWVSVVGLFKVSIGMLGTTLGACLLLKIQSSCFLVHTFEEVN
jgi:hypothetical protein